MHVVLGGDGRTKLASTNHAHVLLEEVFEVGTKLEVSYPGDSWVSRYLYGEDGRLVEVRIKSLDEIDGEHQPCETFLTMSLESLVRITATLTTSLADNHPEEFMAALDHLHTGGMVVLRRSPGWCEWGGREVVQEVHVSLDRDGQHPSKVDCSCGANLTPILHTGHHDKWFWPAHERIQA